MADQLLHKVSIVPAPGIADELKVHQVEAPKRDRSVSKVCIPQWKCANVVFHDLNYQQSFQPSFTSITSQTSAVVALFPF